MENISLAADNIFTFGPLHIQNAVLGSFFVSLILILLAVLSVRRMGIVPTRLQVAFELLVDYMMSQLENAFGDRKKAEKFFPLMMTLLLFILIANQFSVIPLVSDIVAGETSIFAVPTAHLSLTIAMALAMVIMANILALRISPLRYIGTFVTLGPLLAARKPAEIADGLVKFLLGLLNVISELAKVFSLSFRLFGNVFAGEVMVAVIAGLSVYTHYFVPVPFVVLSIFSGLIQAFVFVLLSVQYIAGSIASVQEDPETA